MLAWVLAAAIAHGGVKTEDSTSPRCLDPEKVELEVRAAVGDETVDRMELLVQLSGTEQWQLALTVRDASGTIWNRIVPAEPVDCPYLTELVGQSFERGLSELPGWGLPQERSRPPELGFALSGAWSGTLVGVTGNLWVPLGRNWAWPLHLSYVQTAVELVKQPPGASAVGVAFFGVQAETGLGLNLPLRRQALRLSTRLTLGPVRATGIWGRYDREWSRFRPRTSAIGEILWAPNPYLRVGPRLEVTIVGVRYVTNELEVSREERARVGLVIALGSPLKPRARASDGSRSQRR